MASLTLNAMLALQAANAAFNACSDGDGNLDIGKMLADYPEAVRGIVRELAGAGAEDRRLVEVVDEVMENMPSILQSFAQELGGELTPRLQRMTNQLVEAFGTMGREISAMKPDGGESAPEGSAVQAGTATGAGSVANGPQAGKK